MAGFLVRQGTHDDKGGTLSLIQRGLINKRLCSMDLDDSNPKYTPADKDPIHNDLLGAPYAEDQIYRLIVGMMI